MQVTQLDSLRDRVTITNTSSNDVSMDGWTLSDEKCFLGKGKRNIFEFSKYCSGLILKPNASLSIFSGKDSKTAREYDGTTSVHWFNYKVWDSDADKVYLKDASANVAHVFNGGGVEQDNEEKSSSSHDANGITAEAEAGVSDTPDAINDTLEKKGQSMEDASTEETPPPPPPAKKAPKVKKAPPPPNPNSKRAQKKARQKQKQRELKAQEEAIKKNIAEAARAAEKEKDKKEANGETTDEDEVVFVSEEIPGLDENDPAFEEFKEVFSKFAKAEELTTEARRQREKEEEEAAKLEEAKEAKQNGVEDTAAVAETEEAGLSNKERKKRNRLSIAELKQLVKNPDLVEFHDCNSADPKLLVHLKAYRNTIPVPTHWGAKRKFLQSKRAVEKLPFELPPYIAATGITEIRAQQQEKDAQAGAKQIAKARTAPKTGKMDIDYQVLHDAFFRYQTKPTLTNHGCLYYEGREVEAKLKSKRPGRMSEELKRALGMNDATTPCPWLFNMQRFGPPKAYPNMKIAGVNCPIPPGARYGYGPNEWGKPPVDEYGRPLYGDVFGTEQKEVDDDGVSDISKEQWAQVVSDEEEDEEEDDEEGTDEDEDDDDMESGMESMSSSTSGLETPETLQIRKGDADDSTSEPPRALYTVIDEQKTSVGGGLFGSTHTYNLAGVNAGEVNPDIEAEKRIAAKKASATDAVAVALNPEELESLDAVTLKRKYEAQLEEQSVAKTSNREDVSDIMEEHRQKKRKAAAAKDKKEGGKKFKF